MKESKIQKNIMRSIKKRWRNSLVFKTDPKTLRSFPDLLVLVGRFWMCLEVKRNRLSQHQPNQLYMIDSLNTMGYASIIHGDNIVDIMNDIQMYMDNVHIEPPIFVNSDLRQKWTPHCDPQVFSKPRMYRDRRTAGYYSFVQEAINTLLPNNITVPIDGHTSKNFPDMIVLYKDNWLALNTRSYIRANQASVHNVHHMNSLSFASFIGPSNQRDVFDAIAQTFRYTNTALELGV